MWWCSLRCVIKQMWEKSTVCVYVSVCLIVNTWGLLWWAGTLIGKIDQAWINPATSFQGATVVRKNSPVARDLEQIHSPGGGHLLWLEVDWMNLVQSANINNMSWSLKRWTVHTHDSGSLLQSLRRARARHKAGAGSAADVLSCPAGGSRLDTACKKWPSLS